jgi:hypothetical protein
MDVHLCYETGSDEYRSWSKCYLIKALSFDYLFKFISGIEHVH